MSEAGPTLTPKRRFRFSLRTTLLSITLLALLLAAGVPTVRWLFHEEPESPWYQGENVRFPPLPPGFRLQRPRQPNE